MIKDTPQFNIFKSDFREIADINVNDDTIFKIEYLKEYFYDVEPAYYKN